MRIQPWQVGDDGGADGLDDEARAHVLATALRRRGCRAEVVPPPASLADARDLVEGSRLVVATRFHATVVAAAAGVPFLALAHEQKLAGLARRLGQPAVDAAAPTPVLAGALAGALAQPPAPRAAVGAERAAAAEGFRLLRLLLSRGALPPHESDDIGGCRSPRARRCAAPTTRACRRARRGWATRARACGMSVTATKRPALGRTADAIRTGSAPARLRTVAGSSSASLPGSSPRARATSPSRCWQRGCWHPAPSRSWLPSSRSTCCCMPLASLSAGGALAPAAVPAARRRLWRIGAGAGIVLAALALPLSLLLSLPLALLLALAAAAPTAGPLALERGRLHGLRRPRGVVAEPARRAGDAADARRPRRRVARRGRRCLGGGRRRLVRPDRRLVGPVATPRRPPREPRDPTSGAIRVTSLVHATRNFRRGCHSVRPLSPRRPPLSPRRPPLSPRRPPLSPRRTAAQPASTSAPAAAEPASRAAARRAWPAIAAFLLLAVVQSQDVLFAQRRCWATARPGRFAVVSTLGGIAAFATTTVPLMLLPRAAAGDRRALPVALAVAAALGGAATLVATAAPPALLRTAFGDDYGSVAELAGPYVGAMALLGIARVLVADAAARGRARPLLKLLLAAVALQALLLATTADDAAGIARATVITAAVVTAALCRRRRDRHRPRRPRDPRPAAPCARGRLRDRLPRARGRAPPAPPAPRTRRRARPRAPARRRARSAASRSSSETRSSSPSCSRRSPPRPCGCWRCAGSGSTRRPRSTRPRCRSPQMLRRLKETDVHPPLHHVQPLG